MFELAGARPRQSENRLSAAFQRLAVRPLRSLMRPTMAAGVVVIAACAPAGDSPTVSGPPPAPPWLSTHFTNHPLAGRVYDVAGNRFIEPSEAIARMVDADFVLLGERHDNADHHVLQAWVTGRMIEAGRKPALVMEMMDVSKSRAVRAFLEHHGDHVGGLAELLDWEKSGWPDFDMYRPIIEIAVSADLPVRPGNLPPRETRVLQSAGIEGLPESMVRLLGLDIIPDAMIANALLEDLRTVHCGMVPERVLSGMMKVQNARDGSMARVMANSWPGAVSNPYGDTDGAILIAGAGHTRKDRGVPFYLRQFAPRATVASLAFQEVDDRSADPKTYLAAFNAHAEAAVQTDRTPYDFIWFTPKASIQDPCEMFMRHSTALKRQPA